ncbi:MAG TPA: hypothetical protein VJ643_09275, partial [Nitrososphaera sp.]|nr:hypothetical protein [Nitrososphaera sp.]
MQREQTAVLLGAVIAAISAGFIPNITMNASAAIVNCATVQPCTGTDSSDAISGTDNGETISGRGGGDAINARGGTDTVS